LRKQSIGLFVVVTFTGAACSVFVATTCVSVVVRSADAGLATDSGLLPPHALTMTVMLMHEAPLAIDFIQFMSFSKKKKGPHEAGPVGQG
jgi:hypothetical protein